jgi:hypothetical protein
MTYDELAASVEVLSYRDKFRLAQLLIQLARKEEEEQNPEKRVAGSSASSLEPELVEYVAQRLLKLRPSKKASLLNSVAAMFQFQGGISEQDKEKILAALVKKKVLVIDESNRVSYVN